MYLKVIVMMCCIVPALGQVIAEPDIDDFHDIDGRSSPLSMDAGKMATGNFAVTTPTRVESPDGSLGGNDFQVTNAGAYPATLTIAVVNQSGSRRVRLVTLSPGATHPFGDLAHEHDTSEVEVLSLQDFELRVPAMDRGAVGEPTRGPSERLAMRRVETPSGRSITVGVSPGGQVHYPFHGNRVGVYSQEGGVRWGGGRAE